MHWMRGNGPSLGRYRRRRLGAGYHPRGLLMWVYGFMTGVRSSRKLEGACREQIPSICG